MKLGVWFQQNLGGNEVRASRTDTLGTAVLSGTLTYNATTTEPLNIAFVLGANTNLGAVLIDDVSVIEQ